MIPTSQVISPQIESRSGLDGGRHARLYSSDGEVDGGSVVVEDSRVADGVDSGSSDSAMRADEVRRPRLPHNPGRPTKQEIAEHCVTHWPFRSWCRHCVMGRASASPHRSRTEVDREFSRERIPTISVDHCFMGTAADEESADSSPVLIIYDGETEAIYAVAVPEKSPKPWVVEYFHQVINELG